MIKLNFFHKLNGLRNKLESFLSSIINTKSIIMTPENNKKEQNEELKKMNYSPDKDIFNQEDSVPIDGNGEPILNEQPDIQRLGDDLDVPGSSDDDEMERIGSEDEENNYYSRSDNNENHEEKNEDILT